MTTPASASASPLSIFDFTLDKPDTRWVNVDDPVMGGVSRSTVAFEARAMRFSGLLSLENNGGFASARSARFNPILNASAYNAIRVRVRGDGKIYVFELYSRSDPRLSYQQRFETKAGEWTEHVLPFDQFTGTWRGFQPRGAPPLDPARLLGAGFMLTDKQEGRFALDVAWVRAETTAR
jgi:NADH dehydrogenase [ubiquinone] 1 alpha subcomplex assembly factor 1